MQRVDPAAFLCVWSDGGRLLAIYRVLNCRRAYVCGALSKVPETLAALGGEHVVEIPACGHFPMVEMPEVFYPLLADLISLAPKSPA
ncbi:MAG: hypothetical protein GEV13_08625 [Rhodospirillales bacterium]|nr:hypothetical protein [Rhodospirillales bacterium]